MFQTRATKNAAAIISLICVVITIISAILGLCHAISFIPTALICTFFAAIVLVLNGLLIIRQDKPLAIFSLVIFAILFILFWVEIYVLITKIK